MQKKFYTLFAVFVLGCIALALAVGRFHSVPVENWTPEVSLEGVSLDCGGTDVTASLHLTNNGDRSLLISLHDHPPVLERKIGEDWQRILSTRLPNTATETVEVGEIYSLTFHWADLYGGILPPGDYRMLFYYGDVSAPDAEFYSSAARFTIE